MNGQTNNLLNWIMLVVLVLVFVSGLLLKPFPGMWLGIVHGISGFALVICIVVHCVKKGMFKK